MRSPNSNKEPFKKRLNRWFRQRFAELSPSLGVVWKILIFPIRVLLYPFNKNSLNLFHNSGIETKRPSDLKFHQRIGRFLKWQILLPFQLAGASLRSIGPWIRRTKPRDLIYIAPALLIICFLMFVFSLVFARSDSIKNRYRRGAIVAYSNGDYALAKTYFERLLAEEDLPQEQQLMWAVILGQTGETERANTLVDELAPDSKVGLAKAHRIKALYLYRDLKSNRTKDPAILEKLKWHLEHSNDNSPAIHQVWAEYHLAVGDIDQSIKHLNESAKANPIQYLLISELHNRLGNPEGKKQALGQAERAYRKQLSEDKFDHRSRVALANVLVRQGNIDEAKKILIVGVRIKPDSFIKLASSDFLVMQHDRARAANKDASEQLGFLVDALKMNPNHATIYKRLVAMYMDTKESEDRLNSIRETLQGMVAGDKPSAMAHLALSNVYEQEGKSDQAQFHLEQANKANPRMPYIINNLAWSLAHAEQPDLERALALAETAVGQLPNNPRIRDTYGSILIKLERYREAASELNLALEGAPNQKEIHFKLATAYKKLGMNEQAEIHRKKSIEMGKEAN